MAECIFCSFFRHTKFSGGKGGLTTTGSQTTSTRNGEESFQSGLGSDASKGVQVSPSEFK